MTHFNIQVSVHRVDEAVPGDVRRATADTPRKVRELVSVTVSADTEPEAYDKARRMLDTLAPIAPAVRCSCGVTAAMPHDCETAGRIS